jgi:hypothetical protein
MPCVAAAQRSVPHIILIGPVCAGKSTQAALLAERLHLPRVCLDAIAERYYEECGLGHAVRQRLQAELGFLAFYRQWWPALAHATERLLAERGSGILDLGAGHSHYEDDHLFARVRRVLAPCPTWSSSSPLQTSTARSASCVNGVWPTAELTGSPTAMTSWSIGSKTPVTTTWPR